MLEIGKEAPDFHLVGADGKEYSLADFRGGRLVLYFYPKDSTPGCTRQALAFKDKYEEIVALGAELVGISRDSAASHKKFAEKNGLPFMLLSDKEQSVHNAYEVMGEKKLYGRVSVGVIRTTFIIDASGRIEKIMRGVKPDTNAADIVAALGGGE